MKLEAYIKKHRPFIEKRINAILKDAIAQAVLPQAARGLEKIQSCVTDGKMWRGMLVIMGCEIGKGTASDEVYSAAAALEILHTSLLIHDDIMDNDFKRRNKDSVLYQYIKEGNSKHTRDFVQYGQSMGICVGDIGFFLALEVFTNNIKNPIVLQKMLSLLLKEFQHVTAGQMLDIEHGLTPIEPTKDQILQMYLYKTARYSFSLPLQCGSLLSSKDDASLLSQLGEDLGIIFQLRDDELGMFGQEAEVGKKIGADIRENKKTLLRLHLFEKATKEQLFTLRSIFGRSDISPAEIEFIRGLIKTYGIVELIEQEVQTRVTKINEILETLKNNGAEIDLLQQMVDANLTRKK